MKCPVMTVSSPKVKSPPRVFINTKVLIHARGPELLPSALQARAHHGVLFLSEQEDRRAAFAAPEFAFARAFPGHDARRRDVARPRNQMVAEVS